MLITGISGLLGNNLAWYFRDQYDILGLYHTNRVFIRGVKAAPADLKDRAGVRDLILDFRPDVIIHCASLTNVDRCEAETDAAYAENVMGTRNIVESIDRQETHLVYISSDSVYDGVSGHFDETSPVSPQNYYGLTKYQGENEISRHINSIVFRTNIFGWNIQDKYSLGEWVLTQLQQGKEINGFKDAYFSSIYTMDFARIIDIALQKRITGVYNCGSRNSNSKYEFAKLIAAQFDMKTAVIHPLSVDDFRFNAKRGKQLSLNVEKLQTALDYKFPTIEQTIASFYCDYKCGLPARIKSHQQAKTNPDSEIPYGRQWIDEADVDAVKNILLSKRITQGPTVEAFERELARYCNAEYAVAVNSGTSALHIACLAAGIKDGDEVITSPITFVASANCAVYCGAKPVFADIDKRTYNIDPSEIEKKITKKTKAIILVHFAGQSCDMATIYDIVQSAKKNIGIKYISLKMPVMR